MHMAHNKGLDSWQKGSHSLELQVCEARIWNNILKESGRFFRNTKCKGHRNRVMLFFFPFFLNSYERQVQLIINNRKNRELLGIKISTNKTWLHLDLTSDLYPLPYFSTPVEYDHYKKHIFRFNLQSPFSHHKFFTKSIFFSRKKDQIWTYVID